MVIEPKIGIGGGGTSSDPAYRSTGAQAPFDGSASHNNVQVCGGATFWPVSGAGAVKIGVDVQACSGPSAFGGGDDTLFRILRHGTTGDVDLRARTNAILDLIFKAEVPVASNWFASAGVGPTFRQLDLTLTSNQVPGGAPLVSGSHSGWQTGVAVAGGLSTFVCPNCITGNPLRVGVEGRVRFFPSQSVSVPSAGFPFTETGSTGSTTDYGAMIVFSTPLTMSDIRVKRDIVPLATFDNGIGLYRYRYNWSDQLYVGVMAQEVAAVRPDAVVRGEDGYLRVAYGQLGLRLMTWEEWAARH